LAKTVIIGAGLTGLSAAYHLEQGGYSDYVIYEKENEVGGLCRSVRKDGFVFDYTGHLLHISDKYFHQFLANSLPFKQLNCITRQSRIYSNNCLTCYPFQTNLYGLPTNVIADCIEGFIKRKNIKNPKSFHSWVLTNFGIGLAKHFFFPYQKKILQYNLKKIAASWTGRFVPQTDLKTIIDGAISKQEESIGYNATFYYPKQGGIDQLIKGITSKLKKPINTNYEVKMIDLNRKQVTFSNGHCESYETLINTMPLKVFLQKVIDKSTTTFHQQHKHLVANSVLNINIGTSRKNINDHHWTYIPGKDYPFYRVGFPHLFAQNMAPANCSAIYTEVAYIGQTIDNLPNYVFEKIKKFFALNDREIIVKQKLTIHHAYVIYNFWRERHLETLLAQLTQNNIYSIGRYGAWKYSSMQEAVLDGKKNAETILSAQEKWDPIPKSYTQPSQKNKYFSCFDGYSHHIDHHTKDVCLSAAENKKNNHFHYYKLWGKNYE